MITETGEGLPNSNSYVSLDELVAYCQDRELNEMVDATPRTQRRCLIRATDYIDANYVFKSVRRNDDQALECPRFGEDIIPTKLKSAVIELAVIALTQDLFALPARGVAAKETQVGKIISKTTYDAAAPTKADPFPLISKMLRALATRRGSGVQIGMMIR